MVHDVVTVTFNEDSLAEAPPYRTRTARTAACQNIEEKLNIQPASSRLGSHQDFRLHLDWVPSGFQSEEDIQADEAHEH